MKKNGFTLAEVLITLAIIGVVASLTLPALMANTQEQQAVTGFRKAMNTLNEVAQMNAAVDGFDFGGIASVDTPSAASSAVYTANGQLNQSVWAMMASKAQVDPSRSGSADSVYGNGANMGSCANMTVIGFRDGTFLCYTDNVTNDNGNDVIEAVIDTNGIKAPNRISTCTTDKCLGAGKSIGDQFVITLYNANAIPGRVTVDGGSFQDTAAASSSNNAARWAMSK